MTEKTEEQTTEEITESRNTENDETLHHSSRDRDESEDIRPGSDTDIGQSPNTDDPVDNSDDAEGGKVHREAAKYRTQLRETEAELETMTGQRNQLAQQVIENNLGNLKPNVFWKLAGEVTDYIKDDGTLDLEKVKTTAERIADDLGITMTGPIIPSQEKRPGKVNTGNRLQQAFEPR